MKNILITTFSLILLLTGFSLKSQNFTNYTTTDGLPDNYICGGVAVDAANNKWFGTAAGVAKYDNATWTVYTTANGLIDNFTTCIAVDKNNNVWVGTNAGVSKFNGSTWTNYTASNGLIDNGVVYIAGDGDGSVWFATSVGVSKFDGSVWTSFTTTNGLPTNIIDYIATEPSGSKWFGTQMEGVSIYNNSSFTNINKTMMDSLVDNNVFAIAVDKLNQKWIGTWYGVTLLSSTNTWVKNYRMQNGLYNNYVRDIKIDSNNNVWMGFFADYNQDGGISKFNGSNWVSYDTSQGLVNNQVIRLAIDRNNDVWIATGNGVSKFHETNGISDNAFLTNFSVWPNPFCDKINTGNPTGKEFYELLNPMGQCLWLGANIEQHDFSFLPCGLYLLNVKVEGKQITRKLVKE